MPTRHPSDTDACGVPGRGVAARRHGAPDPSAWRTGLVLTGGGARAAYQADALRAVFDLLDPLRRGDFVSPFTVLCGTSAGAINAAAMAAGAHHPHVSMRRLSRLWSSLRTADVYRADAPGLLRTGVRWLGMLSLGWMFAGWARHKPRSLLDNAPLSALLARTLDFNQLAHNLQEGRLAALAVTASSYTTGQHMTFYQAHDAIAPWRRALRQAVPATIGVDHLMASSAIPFIFPARAIATEQGEQWYGDGSMRQLAPLSPAVRLGAGRILVVGTGHRDDVHPEANTARPEYPSLAQIGGHALSNIFLDSVQADVERLEHINRVLDARADPYGDAVTDAPSRPIRVLTLGPHQSLDDIALAHLHAMPTEVQTLFRVLGISSDTRMGTGGALLSYLLFEGSYTRRLIELGYADTMQRSAEVMAFFESP